MGLPELGAEQKTSRSQQLQLIFSDRTHTEKPVYVVHGEREHFLLTLLLLAHLKISRCYEIWVGNMKFPVFWNVTPCGSVHRYHHLEGRLPVYSTLKQKATGSTEIVPVYQIVRNHISHVRNVKG